MSIPIFQHEFRLPLTE